MMKLFSFFLLSVFCLSCSVDPSGHKSKIELLQGDWKTEKYSRGNFNLHYYHINVQDSVFTFFSKYSDSTRFIIQDNLLTVLDTSNSYYFANPQFYQIVKLNNNELTLIAKSKNVKKHLRDFEWKSDTLRFHKINKKNNLSPRKILLSVSGCYGSCPRLKISIDNQRNVQFYGYDFTTKLGPYSGKLNQKEYDLIIRQVNQLPLKSLKVVYEAPWTDDQTRRLIIETSDTNIKTYVYGTYQEPIELTLLMDNLVDIYKRSRLKKDNQVDAYKSFDKFLHVLDPLLIRPVIVEK